MDPDSGPQGQHGNDTDSSKATWEATVQRAMASKMNMQEYLDLFDQHEAQYRAEDIVRGTPDFMGDDMWMRDPTTGCRIIATNAAKGLLGGRLPLHRWSLRPPGG